MADEDEAPAKWLVDLRFDRARLGTNASSLLAPLARVAFQAYERTLKVQVSDNGFLELGGMVGKFQGSCFGREGTFLGDVAFHALEKVLLALFIGLAGMMTVVAEVFCEIFFGFLCCVVMSFGQEGIHIEESIKMQVYRLFGDIGFGKEEAVKVLSFTYGRVRGLFVRGVSVNKDEGGVKPGVLFMQAGYAFEGERGSDSA